LPGCFFACLVAWWLACLPGWVRVRLRVRLHVRLQVRPRLRAGETYLFYSSELFYRFLDILCYYLLFYYWHNKPYFTHMTYFVIYYSVYWIYRHGRDAE